MVAVLGTALVFALAACGDDEKRAAGSASTNGNSSSTPVSPETDPDTENAEDDSDDAADSSGTACLPGTWLIDNKNVGSMLQGLAGDTDVAEPTGEVRITYSEDGGHSVTYEAWTFRMSQQGTTVEVVRDGTDKGTYQATEDGHLTSADAVMGSVVSMTSPAGTHSTPGEPSTMTGTFSCQGNTLEITVDGATSVMNRQ